MVYVRMDWSCEWWITQSTLATSKDRKTSGEILDRATLPLNAFLTWPKTIAMIANQNEDSYSRYGDRDDLG